MLELPKTLRTANIDEVPKDSSVLKRLKLRENAKIIEGFKLSFNSENAEQDTLPFNFYAEININNSNLWNLIIALSNELPEETAFIFGFDEEELFYGKYLNSIDLLAELEIFKNEITQDTFIELGLIYNDSERLVEIFIPNSKYVQFWGNDELSFMNIMANFNLNEIPDIEFIDEYPKVREPLKYFDEAALDSIELISIWKDRYLE